MSRFSPPALALASLALGNIASGITLQEADFAAEVLSTDDITLEAYKLDYTASRENWTVKIGLGANRYGLDYVNSLFASSARLEETTRLADIAVTREWSKRWQTTLGISAYDGFGDYRSLWLAEYYRENWTAFPAYVAPDPHGHAVRLASAWNYSGAGKVEVSADFARDQVAPAWDFDPFVAGPVSSRETLNTFVGTVRVEQAINGWLKTELAATHQSTSERENRLSFNHSWAASAGRFAARLSGGYTREEPTFEASYAGAALEWNLRPAWTATARYRLYQDTGEVAVSSFTAAAPGLDTRETYLGLLWDRGDLAVSVGVGFLETDYEPLSTSNSFFGELYRDRDWVNVRAATSFRF